jgi:general secretion pathway protein B
MSYILDALRRADAERERGEVPGLHTQQFGVLPDDDEAPRRPRLLIATIVVLVLALAAVLAWNFLGGETAPKTVVVQAQVALPPMPATLAPVLPPAASQAPIVAPAPAPSMLPASAAKETVATRTPGKAQVRREAPAASSAVSASASASDRIYTQAELPEAIRRELPKIAFGGASYSGDKASRMVILNGQVFHEGDTVAAGLVLKQVKQKGAVLAYKGYSYELGF